MPRTRKTSAVSLLIAALMLFSSVPLAAQTGAQTPNDWAAVSALTPGDKLVVKLRNSKTVEGPLTNVSGDALSVSVKGTPTDVKRDGVATIHKVVKKSGTTSALIGAAVGGGAGAAIGAAGGGNDNGFDKIDHAVTAGLAVVGAAAGAVGGYLIGKRNKRVLIYQAK